MLPACRLIFAQVDRNLASSPVMVDEYFVGIKKRPERGIDYSCYAYYFNVTIATTTKVVPQNLAAKLVVFLLFNRKDLGSNLGPVARYCVMEITL